MVRSAGSSACSSRTRVSRGSGTGASRVRRVPGQRPLLQRLLRQHRGTGLDLVDRGPRLGRLERAEVALVDRGHRGDVAGAEALEAGNEEIVVARGGGLE